MKKINVLFDNKKIEERIIEIAEIIDKDYEASKDLVVIGVLNGAVYYFTELTKRIKKDITIDFIKASSYAGTQSTGLVNIKSDITIDITNKDVLIVEDIIDTGLTLEKIKKYLEDKGARSVKISVLLDKKARRKSEIVADYACFDIDDKFVIGYGLDYDEKYRNLPYIGVLSND